VVGVRGEARDAASHPAQAEGVHGRLVEGSCEVEAAVKSPTEVFAAMIVRWKPHRVC